MTLLELPEIAFKVILEKLDYRSIQTLRKVCRDFRNFIDDVVPSSSITDIKVCINLKFFAMKFMSNSIWNKVKYRNHEKGCIIIWFKGEEKRKTRLENHNYSEVFWRDFELILKHQKTILVELNLNFNYVEHFEDPIYTVFTENLRANLKSRKHQLQVKMLILEALFQNEVLSIIPFLRPGILEELEIIDPRGHQTTYLDSEEIEKTEQWRRAKSAKLYQFTSYTRTEMEVYFGRTRRPNLNGEELLSFNEVCKTKGWNHTLYFEMIRDSTIVQHFEVHYAELEGIGSLSDQISNIIGVPFVDSVNGTPRMKWFSKFTKLLTFILAMEIRNEEEKVVIFKSVKVEDVPVGAVIL